MLSERGAPTPVAWTRIRAPRSLMAPGRADGVARPSQGSPLFARYGQRRGPGVGLRDADGAKIAEPEPAPEPQYVPPPPAYEPEPERREPEEPGFLEKAFGSPVVKSFLRSAATQLGREVTRGIFGTRTRSRTTTRRRR